VSRQRLKAGFARCAPKKSHRKPAQRVWRSVTSGNHIFCSNPLVWIYIPPAPNDAPKGCIAQMAIQQFVDFPDARIFQIPTKESLPIN